MPLTVSHLKKLKEAQSDNSSKIYRTFVLFASYLAFGIARTLQGPTLLELQEQLNANTRDFQLIFLVGAITFPVGNLIAGMMMEKKLPPSLLLSMSTLTMAVSTAAIPMAEQVLVLAAASAVAELALGLLDTGINVYCLQLWGDESGPYFNGLYLAQGLGFLLSPILAECMLSEGTPEMAAVPEDDFTISFLNVTNALLGKTENRTGPVDQSWWTEAMPWLSSLTRVQILYIYVSLCSLLISAAFLLGVNADRRSGSFDFPAVLPELSTASHHDAPGDSKSKALSLLGAGDRSRTKVLTAVMSVFFFVTNGTAFSFGNFLTAFVVRSGLGGAEEGARATSMYYAAQVLSRASNLFLSSSSRLLSRRTLVLCYLALFGTGVALLAAFPGSPLVLTACCVLSGAGSGALFPVGLLWVQEKVKIEARAASLFVLFSTCGAQLLRLPEAALIDEHPSVHAYMSLVGTAVALALVFLGSAVAGEGRNPGGDVGIRGPALEEEEKVGGGHPKTKSVTFA